MSEQSKTPIGHAYLNATEEYCDAQYKAFETLQAMFPEGYLADIGCDTYDSSAKLHFADTVPADYCVDKELADKVLALGFGRFWANYADKTEQFLSGDRHPVTFDRRMKKRDDRVSQLETDLADARAALRESERILKVISECTVSMNGKYIENSGAVLRQIAINYFADKENAAILRRNLLSKQG